MNQQINLLTPEIKVLPSVWLDLFMVGKLCIVLFLCLLGWSSLKGLHSDYIKIRCDMELTRYNQLTRRLEDFKKNYRDVTEHNAQFNVKSTSFIHSYLTFMVEQMPSGVWLTAFELREGKEKEVTMFGQSYDHKGVAELLYRFDVKNRGKRELVYIKEEVSEETGLVSFLVSTDSSFKLK